VKLIEKIVIVGGVKQNRKYHSSVWQKSWNQKFISYWRSSWSGIICL